MQVLKIKGGLLISESRDETKANAHWITPEANQMGKHLITEARVAADKQDL